MKKAITESMHKIMTCALLCLILGSSVTATVVQREDTKDYKEAYANILNENWETANTQLDEFINEYPDSPWLDDARFWRCYARENLAVSPEEAFRCYETFLEENSKSKWADDARTNMIRIGQQLVRQGNVEYRARIAALQESENEEITLAALSALQNIGDEDALETIMSLYNRHESQDIKGRIIFILGNSNLPAAKEELLDIARTESDPEMQSSAIFWFGRSADSQQEVDMLRKLALESDNEQVKETAVHAISQAPPGYSLPALREIAENSGNVTMQKTAIHWYGQNARTEAQAEFLTSIAMNNPNVEIREQAVFGLAQMPPQLSEPALLEIAQSETNPDIRQTAIFWLGQNARSPESIQFLRRLAIEDPNPDIRERAVFALSQAPRRLGQDALIEIAKQNGDSEARQNAIFWLGQNGDEESILDLLQDIALNDPDEDVQERAIFALTQVPNQQGIPVLLEIVQKNPQSEAIEQAVFWLGQSAGSEHREDVRKLLKNIALNNPDPEVKERAVYGLAQMAGNEGIPALIDIAKSDANMDIRKNAIYALGRSNDPRAKEALQSILQGEN